MPTLPNFFIAGAPKAGTTSLYHYLDQHPQVYMSPIKEPNYFASEVREENFGRDSGTGISRDSASLRQYLDGPMTEKRFGGIVSNKEDYARLFAGADGATAIGEASVCYLWSPSAPGNIAEQIPDARIIIMLRDPAERAFSQYLHGLGNGAIRWSFREHIERSLSQQSGRISIYHPFLEYGMYSEQIQRYRDRFGASLWIGFYEEFKTDPLAVYQEICEFLGIRSDFEPAMERRYLEATIPRVAAAGWLRRTGLWEATARLTPRALRPLIRHSLTSKPGSMKLEQADRQYLRDYYREDVNSLSRMLDKDLTHWLRDQ